MVAGIGRGDIGGNFCWNCSFGSDSAYTAGFIYLIILDGCSVYIFVTVFNSCCMVGGEIRKIDLIKCVMAVFPCIPDQLTVNNRRNTVGKISGHLVSGANLLAGSVDRCVVNIALAGPEKHKTVAACFYQMRSGGTVTGACVIGKIPYNRSSAGF